MCIGVRKNQYLVQQSCRRACILYTYNVMKFGVVHLYKMQIFVEKLSLLEI